MAYFEEEEAPYKIANSGWPERHSCCGQLWKGSLTATMNFTGKYQLQSQENFEPFMKAMGLPEDLIQKGRDIKGISEIVHNGNHVKLTLTYGPKVVHNEFTLGEECELETMSGEKVKAVVKMEGDNKMVTSFKGMKSVTELNGDTITNTMTLGDIVYKRVSKRI